VKCKICGRIDIKCTCLCGYCSDCVKEYGHERCNEIASKSYDKTGEESK